MQHCARKDEGKPWEQGHNHQLLSKTWIIIVDLDSEVDSWILFSFSWSANIFYLQI